jgi:hypothetical protein
MKQIRSFIGMDLPPLESSEAEWTRRLMWENRCFASTHA